MERSPNIYTEPMSQRLRRAAHFVFDHIHQPEEYRRGPSAQRDVGRTAAQAFDVQAVIAGMQVERTDAAQLRYTQPQGAFGYLDRPDAP